MSDLFGKLKDGRTDLVFHLIAEGYKSDALLPHCAYYGDVTAVRYLLTQGASIAEVDLNGAAFHGHWRLCQFLLEQGADANVPLPDTGETPLHAALCTTDRVNHDRVLQVLLNHGADPNVATLPDKETGGFMRDVRTKGETPLHRAAAFGEAATISMLLDAGAVIHARDMHGDTPLSWASWYLRPTPILRLLLYGDYRINPNNRSMRANLQGDPLK